MVSLAWNIVGDIENMADRARQATSQGSLVYLCKGLPFAIKHDVF